MWRVPLDPASAHARRDQSRWTGTARHQPV